MFNSVLNWLDDRLHIREGFKELLDEPLPEGVGWTHVFGSISLFLFVLQAATGIFISMFYAPTPEAAHASVSYIQNELFLGNFVRGLHHWGSSFFVVFTVIHLLRTFIYSAYKYPRELTWIFGVILFNLVLAFGLTGYLLPWDQKAYWATVVTLNIAGTAPVLGEFIQKILQGGDVIGSVTLTHFYSLHVIVLPLITLGAVSIHVFLQKRQGITPPFKSIDEEVKFSSRFWPDQLFKDGVAILLIFLILSGFAAVFGAPLEKLADLTDTSYVPKPEWYFLSMYQLQKLFPGNLEILGTIIIPTIGVLALLLLPFYDKNPSRKLKDRKLALTLMTIGLMTVGGLTFMGATDDSSGKSTAVVEMVEGEESSRLQPAELSGRYIYQSQSCVQCHNIGGSHGEGENDLLKTSGEKNKEWLKEHFSNPSIAQPDKVVDQGKMRFDQITDLKAFYLRLSTPQRGELLTVSKEILFSANLFSKYKCGACHKIDDPEPGFGPNLVGVTLRHDRAYIYDHFLDPKKYDPNSIMPKFDWLPQKELNALTDFMYYFEE
ncbi:MAG: cytochrome b N-terminal domain-containing protein [Candidatus Marinimicrobia bacterium]|nr:cytochrome b N-terminal domain-containing protein [Candidatus Neomarinimicrobiota bacterium]